jgi:hypothetical protein
MFASQTRGCARQGGGSRCNSPVGATSTVRLITTMIMILGEPEGLPVPSTTATATASGSSGPYATETTASATGTAGGRRHSPRAASSGLGGHRAGSSNLRLGVHLWTKWQVYGKLQLRGHSAQVRAASAKRRKRASHWYCRKPRAELQLELPPYYLLHSK